MNTQPTSIINVARSLLLAESDGMTIMKLQKLCYLAQAYSLAWTGERLVTERFYAHRNGPYSKELATALKGIYLVYYSDLKYTPKSPVPVSGNKAIIVEQVRKTMRGFSSNALRTLFQNEAPLQAGLKNKAGGYLIPETMLEEYYKE
jgi:conserved domain protein